MTSTGASPGEVPSGPGQAATDSAHSPARSGWRVLAGFFAALHIAYVLFVIFGGFLVRLWPPLLWVHLAAVAWAGATMIGNLGCPVTTWEKNFLRRSGRDPYPEGFLQHHVLRTRFDARHTRRNHMLLGGAAILINLGVYLL